MKGEIIEIVLIFGLVLLNGYFAASEIALISARRAALKRAAEAGSKGAKTAMELVDDSSRLLATVQLGITLVGFGASATAAVTLAKPLEMWFRGLGIGWLSHIASALSLVVVTLAIAYVTLVLGEIAPKRLGIQRAESVAKAVSRPIAVIATILRPVVWLLARSADGVALLLGVKPGQGRPGISEEEIKLLVTEQGTLLDEEKRMIRQIFELGDTVVREIMVPRVDMTAVEDSTTLRDAFELLRETGFSRLPVYHDDLDQIVGLLLLKDIVGPIAAGSESDSVLQHMRSPVFVPETKPILSLLSEMQTLRQHLVVVVDEHGGTAGLATIEDVVEEIIGEIADEFDRDRRLVTEVSSGEWVIDGRLPIEDAIAMGLPPTESEEYDTLAGWVLSELGHIPTLGETFEVKGVRFRVQAMRRRRIARIRVTRLRDAHHPDAGALGSSGSPTTFGDEEGTHGT
jgi:putative hemolysin